jgi:hypothetical protein
MDPVRTDLCEGVYAAVRATCTSGISVERDTEVAVTGPMHTFTTRRIVVQLISVAVARGYGAEAGLKVGKLHRGRQCAAKNHRRSPCIVLLHQFKTWEDAAASILLFVT